jgi:hypothetical protein
MPVCPVHQKEMRPGKFGPYCPTKLPDDSWCQEGKKMKGSSGRSAALPMSQVGLPAPVSAEAGSTALACAALAFAGHLCHGTGAEGLTDALACASKAYELGLHLGGK